MALWGRLGGNSDNDSRRNIAYVVFISAVRLWITGAASGGISAAEAVAALQLDAAEETQANRLRTALLALNSDADRRAAVDHLHDVLTFHEVFAGAGNVPLNTGAKVEQSLVDWFAAQQPPVTF